jgi:hypothetical protein
MDCQISHKRAVARESHTYFLVIEEYAGRWQACRWFE